MAQRDEVRRALFSVALQSRTDYGIATAELRTDFPHARPLGLADAIHTLGEKPGLIPRLVVQESIVRLVERRGPGVLQPSDVQAALHFTLGALGLDDPLTILDERRQPVVDEQIHKGMMGAVPNPNGRARWEVPTCTDVAVKTADGADAVSVSLTFRTTRTVAQMAPYVDPNNWPSCSAFFLAMDPVSVARSSTTPTQDWTGVFEEVVELIPGYPMTTPLRFDYHTYGSTRIASTYALMEPTPYLDVDQGRVLVEEDLSDGYQCRITAEKVIHWLNPWLQRWPSVLCDTFWGELGLDMAAECSGGI